MGGHRGEYTNSGGMMRNYVAKHMNTYNRSSVVPNKRGKHLDDLAEQEADVEVDECLESSMKLQKECSQDS